MPQFDIAWYPAQLFWLIVTFTAMVAVMTFAVAPRLRGIIEARQAVVDKDIEAAKSFKVEAETVLKACEEAIASAKAQAEAIVAKAAKEAEAVADARAEEVERKIEDMMAKARAELRADDLRMRSAMKDEAARLALTALKKISADRIPDAVVKKTVEALYV